MRRGTLHVLSLWSIEGFCSISFTREAYCKINYKKHLLKYQIIPKMHPHSLLTKKLFRWDKKSLPWKQSSKNWSNPGTLGAASGNFKAVSLWQPVISTILQNPSGRPVSRLVVLLSFKETSWYFLQWMNKRFKLMLHMLGGAGWRSLLPAVVRLRTDTGLK